MGVLLSILGGSAGALIDKKKRKRGALVGALGLPAAYAAYLYGTRKMEGNSLDRLLNSFNNRVHAMLDPIKDYDPINQYKLTGTPWHNPDESGMEPAKIVLKDPKLYTLKADTREDENGNEETVGYSFKDNEGNKLYVGNKYKGNYWNMGKGRPVLDSEWEIIRRLQNDRATAPENERDYHYTVSSPGSVLNALNNSDSAYIPILTNDNSTGADISSKQGYNLKDKEVHKLQPVETAALPAPET